MADVYKLAPMILKFEGGFVNDPADSGGATNKGVTIATWRKCGYDKDGDGDIDVADLKLITNEDCVERILKPHYWDRWKADNIENQSIANILVDWVWGSGKWGIVFPQRILKVDADGIVGPKTLAAVNGYPNQEELFNRIWKRREQHFMDICKSSPVKYKFLKGWMNRLNAFKFEK